MAVQSKLAVILHADVVGSTALVQKDERVAHERIRAAFQRLSSIARRYGGSTHELRGDALVGEFERASDAVSAALAFQVANGKHNATLDDEIQPRLRIGISLGEVVIADHTVTGAGVVLAQRLEHLAEPGGVCIQGAAYETLPKRLPFEYEGLGEQELKGFDEPVRAYAVRVKRSHAIPGPEAVRAAGVFHFERVNRRWLAAVVVAFCLGIGGLFAWWQPWRPRFERVSEAQMAFPLPDKPSIAVLPFSNMSDDPEQEYFVDGITEDLITDLSKVSGLFVIARNSTFAYKGKSPDVRQVAKELGIRYVLEGSVRRAGDQVRINAQLIDATTGGHLWAERYDGSLQKIFDMQDSVTRRIVSALTVNLTVGEISQRERTQTQNAHAYDAFLQGWTHFVRQTPEDFAKAIPHFEQAVALDPSYGRAYAALAAIGYSAREWKWRRELGLTRREVVRLAYDNLQKAMVNPTALAYSVASHMDTENSRHDDAIANAERAITLESNNPVGYVAKARALIFYGEPRDALEFIDHAMRLNPHYPPSYLHEFALAHFSLENYHKAATALKKSLALNPKDRSSSRLLIATLGHLDRATEAYEIIDGLDSSLAFDLLSVRSVAYWYPFKNPIDTERLAQGLRKAGVPD